METDDRERYSGTARPKGAAPATALLRRTAPLLDSTQISYPRRGPMGLDARWGAGFPRSDMTTYGKECQKPKSQRSRQDLFASRRRTLVRQADQSRRPASKRVQWLPPRAGAPKIPFLPIESGDKKGGSPLPASWIRSFLYLFPPRPRRRAAAGAALHSDSAPRPSSAFSRASFLLSLSRRRHGRDWPGLPCFPR